MAFTGNTSTGPTRTEPANDNSPGNDNMILGHMIGADYTNNMAATYATSPPINCGSATTVHLRFYRWLGVVTGDWAKVEITNNGSNWTEIYSNNGTTSVNTPSNNQWQPMVYDISAEAAGNSAVQIRFQMGSTDGANLNVGWCIDDVEILDPGPPMLVEEGGVGGTAIANDEAVGGLRDWGTVNTSTQSSVLYIAFSNNGLAPITFGAPSMSGNNPTNFTVVKQIANSQIPVGASDTIGVQFWSSVPGVHTASMNVPHDSPGESSPFIVRLRAEAVTPVPEIEVAEGGGTPLIPHDDPAAGTNRDFGTVNVGSASAPLTIDVTNTGNVDLSISGIQMDGSFGDWSQFQVDTTGWVFPAIEIIQPAQTKSFEVTFEPTSAGAKSARVLIAHNDNNHPSYPYYHVPVIGDAIGSAGPALQVQEGATTLNHNQPPSGGRDFGNVQVGTTSNPITITINNPGTADLTVTNLALGGPDANQFNLILGGFSSPIPAGGSDSFDVTFEPTSVGQKDAWIEFNHNDTGVTDPFRINLTGNGVNTSPTAGARVGGATGTPLTNPAPATGALDFGQQDITAGPTAPVVIYVENTGTADLTLNAPSLGGASPGEFALQNAGGFAGTYQPGQSATFEILFNPNSVGNHDATVSFTHNDTATGSPFVINVTGEGILNAPVVEVREGSVTGTVVNSGDPAAAGGGRDLGSIDVTAGASAPVTIVVLNTGTLVMNLGTPSLAGANANQFSLDTTGTSATLAPGADTSFEVSFDPNLGGMKDAQVEFTHDDPTNPSPFVVRIRGTAVDPNGVQITTSTLPPGAADNPYGPVQMQAIQGAAPYTWSVYEGTLPAGVSLAPGGQIDGTPTGFGGVFNVTIRVEDTSTATHERQYTVVVSNSLLGSGRAKRTGCTSTPTGTAALIALLAILATATVVRRRRA